MTVPLLHYDYLGSAPERLGLAHPSIAPYGGFELADGSVVLISIQSDREWRALCEGSFCDPELGTDPDYATNVARVRNRERTDGSSQHRSLTAVARRSAGHARPAREIAFSTAQRRRRALDAPASAAVPVAHAHGVVEIPAPPVRTDWERVGPIPEIDEHGAQIRAAVESADQRRDDR